MTTYRDGLDERSIPNVDSRLITDTGGPYMHVMRILDSSGDTTLTWEPKTDSAEAIREKFDEIIAQGYMAYSFATTKSEPVMTRTFDETAAKVIVAPRVVGG